MLVLINQYSCDISCWLMSWTFSACRTKQTTTTTPDWEIFMQKLSTGARHPNAKIRFNNNVDIRTDNFHWILLSIQQMTFSIDNNPSFLYLSLSLSFPTFTWSFFLGRTVEISYKLSTRCNKTYNITHLNTQSTIN